MKRRKLQRIQDNWNGDKKWDKWGNKSVFRALLSWALICAAIYVPALVINAILPTLYTLAKYAPILTQFARAALAICALLPFEVFVWRAVKDLFTRL